MTTFIVKKILATIPMLIIISIIVFVAIKLMPGDPVSYLAPPDVASNSANLEALRKQLGLDNPIYIQYLTWLRHLLEGKFGYSITTGNSISRIIRLRLPATLELSGCAILFSTIFGILLGLIAAIRKNTIVDGLTRIIGVIGISIPEFFFGIIGIQILSIKLGWLPIGGRINEQSPTFLGSLPNLILPSITLSVGMLAVLLRYARSALLDVLNKEYIKTARSKGIPEWKVYWYHAFRNSLRPILVILIFRIPLLVGGSIIIEQVFSWPGIGSALLSAITSDDYPVIMVTTMMIATVILLASALIDVFSAMLDPRIRLQ
ncbi:ABC transporter permease [Alicyclobacillus sp. SO9]|uniref:ABC transporter permease n=1 Tax=Alicyclobacillus sp. SO9 TaxID=2665646 RepID=UPI0018E8B66C|nr:ABC transporter permease [Alicyclobacillus sp. SO9]QQE78414.1 ABC transporter permease [Alicyclobacillus sp. SO9]